MSPRGSKADSLIYGLFVILSLARGPSSCQAQGVISGSQSPSSTFRPPPPRILAQSPPPASPPLRGSPPPQPGSPPPQPVSVSPPRAAATATPPDRGSGVVTPLGVAPPQPGPTPVTQKVTPASAPARYAPLPSPPRPLGAPYPGAPRPSTASPKYGPAPGPSGPRLLSRFTVPAPSSNDTFRLLSTPPAFAPGTAPGSAPAQSPGPRRSPPYVPDFEVTFVTSYESTTSQTILYHTQVETNVYLQLTIVTITKTTYTRGSLDGIVETFSYTYRKGEKWTVPGTIIPSCSGPSFGTITVVSVTSVTATAVTTCVTQIFFFRGVWTVTYTYITIELWVLNPAPKTESRRNPCDCWRQLPSIPGKKLCERDQIPPGGTGEGGSCTSCGGFDSTPEKPGRNQEGGCTCEDGLKAGETFDDFPGYPNQQIAQLNGTLTGMTYVPTTIGTLQAGHILVASQDVGGGSTIYQINPASGVATPWKTFTASAAPGKCADSAAGGPGVSLSLALEVLQSGHVIVGSMPIGRSRRRSLLQTPSTPGMTQSTSTSQSGAPTSRISTSLPPSSPSTPAATGAGPTSAAPNSTTPGAPGSPTICLAIYLPPPKPLQTSGCLIVMDSFADVVFTYVGEKEELQGPYSAAVSENGTSVSLFVGNSLSTHGYVNRYNFEVPNSPVWPDDVLGRPTLVSRDFDAPTTQGPLQNFRYGAPGGMAYNAVADNLYIAKGGDTSGAPIRVVPGAHTCLDRCPLGCVIEDLQYSGEAVSRIRGTHTLAWSSTDSYLLATSISTNELFTVSGSPGSEGAVSVRNPTNGSPLGNAIKTSTLVAYTEPELGQVTILSSGVSISAAG